MLLLMLMTNVYVSIIWNLIFFASGVQALRKLTYINLMVLEVSAGKLWRVDDVKISNTKLNGDLPK